LIPGLIFLTKPVDLIALVPVAVYFAVQCFCAARANEVTDVKRLLSLAGIGALGLAIGLCVAATAHLLIYGWQLSDYQRFVTRDGAVFIWNTVPIKLYSLFVDPSVVYGHYLEPRAIFVKYPWILAGVGGMILALFHDLRMSVLALCVLAYVVMYAAYCDMIPNGLWYYSAAHYFTWCFPVFGLFAFVFFKRLLKVSVTDATIIVASCLLVLGWRPALQPIASSVTLGPFVANVHLLDGRTPFLIEIDGVPGDPRQIYFTGPWVDWGNIELRPFNDTKMIPTERGARALLMNAGNGNDLTISWVRTDVRDIHRVTPYALTWTFL